MHALCRVKTPPRYRSVFTAPSLVLGRKKKKKEEEERKEEEKGRRWEGRKESRETGGREGGTGGRKSGVQVLLERGPLTGPRFVPSSCLPHQAQPAPYGDSWVCSPSSLHPQSEF